MTRTAPLSQPVASHEEVVRLDMKQGKLCLLADRCKQDTTLLREAERLFSEVASGNFRGGLGAHKANKLDKLRARAMGGGHDVSRDEAGGGDWQSDDSSSKSRSNASSDADDDSAGEE